MFQFFRDFVKSILLFTHYPDMVDDVFIMRLRISRVANVVFVDVVFMGIIIPVGYDVSFTFEFAKSA